MLSTLSYALFFFPLLQVAAVAKAEASGPDARVLFNGKYMIGSEGIRATFIPYGASLTDLFIEDIHGVERDIVLGFDNATFYSEDTLHPHLNGVPGRYANRIKNGTFTIDSVTYQTDLNEKGLDTLHGGSDGWDYRNWTVVAHTSDSITFSLVDPDGKEGFPGQAISYVTYTVTPYQWHLHMTARSTSEKTPIMLTSHTYLNLDGFQNPDTPLALDHGLYMPYSKQRIAIDSIEIPTGEILDNEKHCVHDFWSGSKQLGANITSPNLLGSCGFNCTGYDNCYIFDGEGSKEHWRQAPVATLISPWSGIQLDLFTDQHAMQVYTCNNMNGSFPLKQTQGFHGKASRPRVVEKYGCVVLEVEDWIDGINNPEWSRDKYQIFGPSDDPHVLQATYKFSLSRGSMAEDESPT